MGNSLAAAGTHTGCPVSPGMLPTCHRGDSSILHPAEQRGQGDTNSSPAEGSTEPRALIRKCLNLLIYCCATFFIVLFRFVFPLYRIKLKKAKSIRDKMREAGVLEDYLKNVKYKPASEAQVVYEPITNHLDVSPGSPLPLPSCLQRDLFTPSPRE